MRIGCGTIFVIFVYLGLGFLTVEFVQGYFVANDPMSWVILTLWPFIAAWEIGWRLLVLILLAGCAIYVWQALTR